MRNSFESNVVNFKEHFYLLSIPCCLPLSCGGGFSKTPFHSFPLLPPLADLRKNKRQKEAILSFALLAGNIREILFYVAAEDFQDPGH